MAYDFNIQGLDKIEHGSTSVEITHYYDAPYVVVENDVGVRWALTKVIVDDTGTVMRKGRPIGKTTGRMKSQYSEILSNYRFDVDTKKYVVVEYHVVMGDDGEPLRVGGAR